MYVVTNYLHNTETLILKLIVFSLIHNLGIRRTHCSIFETWGGNLLRAKQNKIQIAFHYVTILQKK
jgi:hypothetical protein